MHSLKILFHTLYKQVIYRKKTIYQVEKVAADHCYITAPKDSKRIEKEDIRYIPDMKSSVNDSSRPDDYIIKRD
jgi:hypothetical protein